jgi:hypothetical protein
LEAFQQMGTMYQFPANTRPLEFGQEQWWHKRRIRQCEKTLVQGLRQTTKIFYQVLMDRTTGITRHSTALKKSLTAPSSARFRGSSAAEDGG